MEHARLRDLHPAVARRVLRAAARRLGARLSFEHTEQLLAMAQVAGGRGAKFDLPGGISVERSLREIRLTRISSPPGPAPEHAFRIPGEVVAPEYGLRLRGESALPGVPAMQATLRPWRAGDRVTLKHSRGPKKVAEVLDRLRVVGAERTNWPVVESDGKIVWMRGADVDAPEYLFAVVT
jgi:tRNA(Ile)-lysidine synthase